MNFDAPQSLSDVENYIAGLQPMPTDLPSAAISTWPKEVRQLGLYSARTTSLGYLQEMQKILADYAASKIDLATVTMKAKECLAKWGYDPETGFPGEAPVPPAKSLLENLVSSPRIQLLVNTIAGRGLSTGYLQKGMTDDARFNFPCWQFRRMSARRVPRGESGKESDPTWQERWVRSGGTLYGPAKNLMIAPKDDDVWDNISDSGIWPDGMDSDSDPVVFNTGYERVDVARDRCIELGVIASGEGVEARNISLIGKMFDKDPDKTTLGDITAKRAALLATLKHLEEAA